MQLSLPKIYMVITSVDHREEILFGNYPSVDVTGMVINQPVAGREEVTEALSHDPTGDETIMLYRQVTQSLCHLFATS